MFQQESTPVHRQSSHMVFVSAECFHPFFFFGPPTYRRCDTFTGSTSVAATNCAIDCGCIVCFTIALGSKILHVTKDLKSRRVWVERCAALVFDILKPETTGRAGCFRPSMGYASSSSKTRSCYYKQKK